MGGPGAGPGGAPGAAPGGGAGLTAAVVLAVFCMGNGAWLLVNSIFTEGPFLTGQLPEGCRLFSTMGVLFNAGTLICFSLVLFFSEYTERNLFKITFLALAAQAVGAIALVIDWGLVLGGHSVMVLFAATFAGLGGAVCTTTIFGTSSRYGRRGISLISSGMGSSGVTPVVLAVFQGLYREDGVNFSSEWYFVVALLIQLTSIVACVWVWRLDVALGGEKTRDLAAKAEARADGEETSLLGEADADALAKAEEARAPGARRPRTSSVFAPVPLHTTLAVAAVTAAMEFALPGLLPYVNAATGAVTQGELFGLAALFNISSVMGRSLSGWVRVSFRTALLLLLAQAVCFFIAHLMVWGELRAPYWFATFLVTAISGLHGYVVTECVQWASKVSSLAVTKAGLAIQGGTGLGSLVTFVLVQTLLDTSC